MENGKVKFASYMLLGSALFGLFFGAGNIIFPIQIGQNAGWQMIPATLGFIITAAGLPFLGILVLGRTETTGIYDLARRVGPRFALMLTLLLYLTIGPLFALPRTASVAYEVAFASYVPPWALGIGLLAFTLIFFGAAYYFSSNPQKIMDLVGKYLNPLFLFFLGIVVIAAILFPMGNVFTAPALVPYDTKPFFAGLLNGYDTMDGLASLAFGMLVIERLHHMGVKDPKKVSRSVIISGVIVLLLMGLIYASLVYVGGTSTGIIPVASNGGLALAQITNHYFGIFGAIVLALIVIFACLKTAIGLITACAEMFAELYPRFSYQQYMSVVVGFALLVANFGLTTIIEFAKPFLMFIYPLSIALMFLGLCENWFDKSKVVYGVTIAFVMYASLADFMTTLGQVSNNDTILHIGLLMQQLLPFSAIGLSWLVPLLLGFVIGISIYWMRGRGGKKQASKKSKSA